MKTCRTCKEEKPLSEFYTKKGSADGVSGECKSCTRARSARRRAEKPDGCKKAIEEWTKKNQTKVKAYKKKHYEANRREIIDRSTKWVEDNRDRRYETWRAWYDTNPEARARASRKRRASMFGADVRVVTQRDWDSLIAHYRGLCAYCMEKPWKHRDHIVPVSRGGRHSIGNLIPSCTECNLSKKDKTIMEWKLHRRRRNA